MTGPRASGRPGRTRGPTDAEALIRRTVHSAAVLTMSLPPLAGGTVMALAGFYPWPEVYRMFAHWAVVGYVLAANVLAQLWARRTVTMMMSWESSERGRTMARSFLEPLPWKVLAVVVAYSIGGITLADHTLEALGVAVYDASAHMGHYVGLIPVVGITVFPVYFYTVDRIGRALAPRGLLVVASSLRARIVILGLLTPLLIDSLLIAYHVNTTGSFDVGTFFAWSGLMGLAAGGTWLALNSLRQGLAPLESFASASSGSLPDRARAALIPSSLDELGILTARIRQLLRREAQSALLADTVIEQANALVVALDPEGRIVRFNRACEDVTGYAEAEVLGLYPWDVVIPPEQATTVRNAAFEALANDPDALTGRYRNDWIGRSGERHTIDWSNAVVRGSDGAMDLMISVGTDVTERARIDSSLRHSEALLDTFFSQSLDGCFFMMLDEPIEWSDAGDKDSTLDYVFSHQRMSRVNEAMLAQYGATEDDFLGLTPGDLMAGDIPEGRRLWRDLFDQGRLAVKTCEHKLDGTPMYVEGEYVALYDGEGRITGHFGIQRDVTERERLEEESLRTHERLAEAQRTARIGSWELDLRTDALVWTDEIYRLFQLDPHTFGASYEAFLGAIHPDDRDEVNAAYSRSLDDRAPYVITHRLLLPSGDIKWVEERCETDFAEDGTPLVSRGTVQDVTERILAEKAMREALEEKEVLLREIHHRVKNNLQVVSSLIHFHAKKVHDPLAVQAFDDARQRLRAMILVHEKLYQSGDLARVNFLDYLKALVAQLSASSMRQDGRIDFAVLGEATALPIEQAIPAGMIVVELVTNVLKYAFPSGDGDASIELAREGDLVSITVSDDGVGLPPGFEEATPSTFGWQLVRALSAQLRATVSFGDGRGTRITIEFETSAATS